MSTGEATGKSVWMTDEQFFQVLDEMGVGRVSKPEGGKITLHLVGGNPPEETTVTDVKSRSHEAIQELDDQRREVRENRFAGSLTRVVDLGGSKTSEVQYLKRDDQLTAEELDTKKRLLEEIEAAVARHRIVIAAMNHLQVNYRELQGRLQTLGRPSGSPGGVQAPGGGRMPWTKGIKSAALHCIRESKKPENAGKSELDLCREFLAHYVIQEDDDYSAEHLYRNIQQVKLLDDVA